MPNPRKKTQAQSNSKIRIIAGQWRGRKLDVANEMGLRPTGDRLRETLFNWLAPYIEGARCLDAFAGTGALGLEALSRGAAEVQFIESNPRTASVLRNNLQLLHANNAKLSTDSCFDWLKHNQADTYDIIFLDPPFAENLWQASIEALQTQLARGTYVYIEAARGHSIALPDNWHTIKQKDTGQVSIQLCETM